MPRLLALVAVLGLALLACTPAGDPAPSPAPQPAPTTPTPTTPQPSPPDGDGEPPAAPEAGRPQDTSLDAVAVTLSRVARLSAPTAMAVRPGDDSLYVGERGGRVQRVVDGDVEGPVLDLSGRTTTGGERGLLGLAFAPDGATLYVSLTDRDGHSLVESYRVAGGGVDAGSRQELLRVEQPFANHNGGHLAFGPDGYLYFGLGDGGGAGDPLAAGQDPGTLLGSLLRLDPDGDGGYTIPPDNPFADGDGGRPEVWAYGLRNPWRFSFDRQTGDLWIGDVGQSAVEEIDFMPAGRGAGANYGWSSMEGTRDFDGSGAPPGHVPPLYEYPRDAGRCAITGGVVYRGDAMPALQGTYLFGDFCDGAVRALEVVGGAVTGERELGVAVDELVSFGEGGDGEVYVLSLSGELFRLDPA